MTARAFWLGRAPLIAADTLGREALPADLRDALVVQPEPLAADEVRGLLTEVRARGGRLALQLGAEPPLEGELFQFSREACCDDELRRQLESLLAEPAALLPPVAHFKFRSYRQVEAVALAVAALLSQPERRLAGLVELLLNACEHGSLGIREEKQTLLVEGRWLDELDRRERTPPWSSRHVCVEVQRAADGQTVTITDEGEGFDYTARRSSGTFHGRGVELARSISFDSVEFEGRGNRVVAKVRR